MSDSSSDSYRKCGYCGSYHAYSELMCRDNFANAGIEPHGDCTDLRWQLVAARLDNDRLRRLLWMARANWCPIDSAAKSELEREVDAALAAPADDLAERVRDDIQRVHDLCFGESASVGTPGDISHVQCDHAEAHRILDALLVEIGGRP